MSSINPFESAMTQLDRAAKFLPEEESYVNALRLPQRQVEVRIPVRMDDGGIQYFQGYRVQYDNARGPYKGGIRFHQDTDISEVKALAFWMAIKCATVNIPYGGGKGGVTVNPKNLSEGEIERIARGWTRAMQQVIGPSEDIPAPDVNTTPQIMAWIADEYAKLTGEYQPGVITGKPLEVGGSQGRNTATAQGAFYCLEETAKQKGLNISETKVVVQGFGNAGFHFARLCHEAGYKVVAVSDSQGGIYAENGLYPQDVMTHKEKTGSVRGMPGTTEISQEELLALSCDVLAPAALENVLTKDNAANVKASIVVELANGPTTPEADDIMNANGIFVIPDVLANAGGVTTSYFEWVQNNQGYYWSEEEVLAKLEPIMKNAYHSVYNKQEEISQSMRTAAFVLAVQRIAIAMKLRGI